MFEVLECAPQAAIRVPPYALGNTVQKRDGTLPGEDLDPGRGKDGHQGGPGVSGGCKLHICGGRKLHTRHPLGWAGDLSGES